MLQPHLRGFFSSYCTHILGLGGVFFNLVFFEFSKRYVFFISFTKPYTISQGECEMSDFSLFSYVFFFFSFFQYHYHLSKNYVRLPWFASRISTSSRFLRAYVLFCIWSKISALISFIVNKKISKFKNQSFKILKCKKKILSVFFFYHAHHHTPVCSR